VSLTHLKTTFISGSKCTVSALLGPKLSYSDSLSDGLSSLEALTTALADLDTVCETVENAYDTSLKAEGFERWTEIS
jgi:hypothetical protein